MRMLCGTDFAAQPSPRTCTHSATKITIVFTRTVSVGDDILMPLEDIDHEAEEHGPESRALLDRAFLVFVQVGYTLIGLAYFA